MTNIKELYDEWGLSDELYLKNNYFTMSISELSQKLDKTEGEITFKLFIWGKSEGKGNLTLEQKLFVLNRYGYETLDELTRLHKLPVNQVKAFLYSIGVYSFNEVGKKLKQFNSEKFKHKANEIASKIKKYEKSKKK